MRNYSFSLVIPTINRRDELKRLFKSLLYQSYSNFEIIIVDQNEIGFLDSLIKEYEEKFSNFSYIHSERKGAAYNRNFGASFAKNEIITFPDDDCIYKSTTLDEINNFINENINYDFYFCNLEYIKSKKNRYKKLIDDVKFYNANERGIEFTYFYKKDKIPFLFDEDFGVGSKWGSNEIVDLIWNNLSNGKKGIYNGNIAILHPDKSNLIDFNRTYNYAIGFGASYKKGITIYKKKFLFFQFVKAIIKNLIAIIIMPLCKKKTYIYSLKGKVKGFKDYKG